MKKFLRITKTVQTTAETVKDTVETVTTSTRNLMFYIIAAVTFAVLMVILGAAGAINWIIG